jgi:arylsulfatase A-like enzyme
MWFPGSEFFSMGGAGDDGTMTTALELFAREEPDLAVVQLADVDRHGHGYGPDSPEYARAVGAADAAIRRLVDRLEATGRWPRSVLVVTADHGFSSVAPTAERPRPVIDLGAALRSAGATGVHVVSDGPVAHVYATGLAAAAATVGDTAAALARAAEVFRGLPGVAEVLARLPVPGVRLLAEAHPDWHLGHQRTGELFLVAARGYEFADATDLDDEPHRGNHGGPHEQVIPLFVAGGFAGLRVAAPTAPPSSAAVGRTIALLLGLPPPARVDGSALAALPPPIVALLPPADGAAVRARTD